MGVIAGTFNPSTWEAEAKFSFGSGYQLGIASELGMKHVSTSFKTRFLSSTDPCRVSVRDLCLCAIIC